MLKIKNNEITISKGDDAVIDFSITKNGFPFSFADGDKLVFTISTPTPIVKELTTPTLVLASADTKDIAAGTYEYDIKMVYASGEQLALIYPTQFFIKDVL